MAAHRCGLECSGLKNYENDLMKKRREKVEFMQEWFGAKIIRSTVMMMNGEKKAERKGRPRNLIANTTNCLGNIHPKSLLHCILLPLLCVFLLPTIRLDQNRSLPSTTDHLSIDGHQSGASLLAHILAQLLRLPYDRIQLQSGLLVSAEPVARPTRNDLQEEEQAHVMLMAPPGVEHRSSYASSPVQQQQQQPATQSMSYVDSNGHETSATTNGETQQYAGEVQDQQPQSGGGEQTAGTLLTAEGSSSSTSLQARADLPAVRALNVKCEKNHMTVNIVFDRPFYGMVFSKGHYNDQKCVHLAPNSGQTSVNFDIHLGKCGMSSSDASGQQPHQLQTTTSQQQQQQPNGVFIENTIIIQYDPLVQEIYDQARKLRCTWYDYYEKSVTFRPYNVDMLDAVTANFLGDNIQCWMQIQVGKGPWSSEVAGIVKIGQTMTMVLAIKDDENRFDMLVRNCVAHDGKHAPIQLVDEYGCVARPKIMSRFQKVRNFGPAATVVSYAHFQAFKFPDSMSVHFQCVIQVCRYECPEPVCNGASAAAGELGASAGAPQTIATAPNPTSSSSSSSASQMSDYATSGTEMIAAKEPLPLGYHAHPAAIHHPHHPHHTNYSNLNVNEISSNGHNAHQLKLDESQGRVQVRLDTSMMAAVRSGPAAAHPSGPLPPHLLHLANSDPAHARTTIGRQAALIGLPNQSARRPPSSSPHVAAVAPLTPPGRPQPQQVHYSTPYHQQAAAAASSRRSTAGSLFTHRMGGLSQDQDEGAQPNKHQQLGMTAPYEQYPLSLIASPRGLQMSGVALASSIDEDSALRRLRRSLNASVAGEMPPLSSDANKKHSKRHLSIDERPQTTTSVQTQKTIQVVSPDDVAFSLMGLPDDETQYDGSMVASNKRWMSTRDSQTPSICFSAGRFLWVTFITLSALATSIVAAAYVIWRQRAQLEQKISSVYDSSSPPLAAAAAQSHTTTNSNNLIIGPDYQQHQQALYQRQQEELRQRQNYLARLYSQFTPSSYWR